MCIRGVQVELCYKTSATMMQYGQYCDARAVMNEAIGGWITHHDVTFSAAYQQAFAAKQPRCCDE
jgi:hypothetical protein